MFSTELIARSRLAVRVVGIADAIEDGAALLRILTPAKVVSVADSGNGTAELRMFSSSTEVGPNVVLGSRVIGTFVERTDSAGNPAVMTDLPVLPLKSNPLSSPVPLTAT